MFLHYAGEEVNNIFDILTVEDATDDISELDQALKALHNYFSPKKNVEFEVYKFRQGKQQAGERIAAFYTRLAQLAKSCEFHDTVREIKTQIMQNCTSTRLRRKVLADPTMNLDKLISTHRQKFRIKVGGA